MFTDIDWRKRGNPHGPQRVVGNRHSFRQCCEDGVHHHLMVTSSAVGAPVELSCSAAQHHQGQGEFLVKAQVGARESDKVHAARSRVERLERAVVLGDSAEIRGLQAALKEARRAAQDRPLTAQVEECQACIQRSQRNCSGGTRQRTAAVGHRRAWQDFERRWPR